MSHSSSSSSASFVLIMLALGGFVWLVQHGLKEPSKPAEPAEEVPTEPVTSTQSRALDFSKTNGEALNNSMNDQLKSVQQMMGGEYDGKTYVLPQTKR